MSQLRYMKCLFRGIPSFTKGYILQKKLQKVKIIALNGTSVAPLCALIALSSDLLKVLSSEMDLVETRLIFDRSSLREASRRLFRKIRPPPWVRSFSRPE
jgi:hypothetical protein